MNATLKKPHHISPSLIPRRGAGDTLLEEGMNNYILFLRNETIDFSSYSPEESQSIMSDFDKWNQEMIQGGLLVASGSLQGGEGRTFRAGGVVSDGPYSESKEVVTGFLMIQANDLDHATEIASHCPFLPRGGSVEVRPIPEMEFEDAAQAILTAHAKARKAKKG
jgi:hypothetical protein